MEEGVSNERGKVSLRISRPALVERRGDQVIKNAGFRKRKSRPTNQLKSALERSGLLGATSYKEKAVIRNLDIDVSHQLRQKRKVSVDFDIGDDTEDHYESKDKVVVAEQVDECDPTDSDVESYGDSEGFLMNAVQRDAEMEEVEKAIEEEVTKDKKKKRRKRRPDPLLKLAQDELEGVAHRTKLHSSPIGKGKTDEEFLSKYSKELAEKKLFSFRIGEVPDLLSVSANAERTLQGGKSPPTKTDLSRPHTSLGVVSSQIDVGAFPELPENYYMTEETPIVPYDVRGTQGAYEVEFQENEPSGNLWAKTVFPSLVPSSRKEVIQLRRTLNKMLKDQGLPSEYDTACEVDAGDTNIVAEMEVCDAVMKELIRQVSVHCRERGRLLSHIYMRVLRIIRDSPRQLSDYAERILALETLTHELKSLLEVEERDAATQERLAAKLTHKVEKLTRENEKQVRDVSFLNNTLSRVREERDEAVNDAERLDRFNGIQERMNTQLVGQVRMYQRKLMGVRGEMEKLLTRVEICDSEKADIMENLESNEWSEYPVGEEGLDFVEVGVNTEVPYPEEQLLKPKEAVEKSPRKKKKKRKRTESILVTSDIAVQTSEGVEETEQKQKVLHDYLNQMKQESALSGGQLGNNLRENSPRIENSLTNDSFASATGKLSKAPGTESFYELPSTLLQERVKKLSQLRRRPNVHGGRRLRDDSSKNSQPVIISDEDEFGISPLGDEDGSLHGDRVPSVEFLNTSFGSSGVSSDIEASPEFPGIKVTDIPIESETTHAVRKLELEGTIKVSDGRTVSATRKKVVPVLKREAYKGVRKVTEEPVRSGNIERHGIQPQKIEEVQQELVPVRRRRIISKASEVEKGITGGASEAGEMDTLRRSQRRERHQWMERLSEVFQTSVSVEDRVANLLSVRGIKGIVREKHGKWRKADDFSTPEEYSREISGILEQMREHVSSLDDYYIDKQLEGEDKMRQMRKHVEELEAQVGGFAADGQRHAVKTNFADAALEIGPEDAAGTERRHFWWKERHLRSKFLQLLGPFSKGPSVQGIKPLVWLLRIIRQVFDDRATSNAAAIRQNSKPTDFPEYVVFWTTRKYGLQSLAEHNCYDIFLSMETYKQENSEVELFRRFVEEEYNVDQLAFFLVARSLMEEKMNKKLTGLKEEFGDVVLPRHITMTRATAIVHRLFYHRKTPERVKFLRVVECAAESIVDGKKWVKKVERMKFLHLCVLEYRKDQLRFTHRLSEVFESMDSESSRTTSLSAKHCAECIVICFPHVGVDTSLLWFNELLDKDEESSGQRITLPEFLRICSIRLFMCLQASSEESNEEKYSDERTWNDDFGEDLLVATVSRHWLASEPILKKIIGSKSDEEVLRMDTFNTLACRLEELIDEGDSRNSLNLYRQILSFVFSQQLRSESQDNGKLDPTFIDSELFSYEELLLARDSFRHV